MPPRESQSPLPHEGFQRSSFTFLYFPPILCSPATQSCPSAPDRPPYTSFPQCESGAELGVIIGPSFSCTFVTGQSESLPCFIICLFHAPFLLSSSGTLEPPLTHLVVVSKYAHVLGEDVMSCSVCMFLIYIDAINTVSCLFHSILF